MAKTITRSSESEWFSKSGSDLMVCCHCGLRSERQADKRAVAHRLNTGGYGLWDKQDPFLASRAQPDGRASDTH